MKEKGLEGLVDPATKKILEIWSVARNVPANAITGVVETEKGQERGYKLFLTEPYFDGSLRAGIFEAKLDLFLSREGLNYVILGNGFPLSAGRLKISDGINPLSSDRLELDLVRPDPLTASQGITCLRYNGGEAQADKTDIRRLGQEYLRLEERLRQLEQNEGEEKSKPSLQLNELDQFYYDCTSVIIRRFVERGEYTETQVAIGHDERQLVLVNHERMLRAVDPDDRILMTLTEAHLPRKPEWKPTADGKGTYVDCGTVALTMVYFHFLKDWGQYLGGSNFSIYKKFPAHAIKLMGISTREWDKKRFKSNEDLGDVLGFTPELIERGKALQLWDYTKSKEISWSKVRQLFAQMWPIYSQCHQQAYQELRKLKSEY